MKTATTRDQYSGLNCSGVSTMMKRIGRDGSIDGIARAMCRIDALDDDVASEDSGGVYVPPSRKDLTFDMRSSEEADGDTRMMGSGRRLGFWLMASAGLRAPARESGCAALRPMKVCAILRTCEKSFGGC